MNNLLFLTFFLLFFTFSSFETKRIYYKTKCFGGGPCSSPDTLEDFYNDSGEMLEKYYNQKSNDQESGLIDCFDPFIPVYSDYHKNETDVVNCYWFFIIKKKFEDSKINATDPRCQRNDWENHCTGCVFGHVLRNGTSEKVINNQIISIDCNNVHYQHPTLRIPARFCKETYVSPNCHPNEKSL